MSHAAVVDDGAFYRQYEAQFDESQLTQRPHSKNFLKLQAYVERRWHEYCALTQRDSVHTIRQLETRTASGFLDWMLRSRAERLQRASSLLTYWNALCTIRSKHTNGVQLDPLIKTQMIGVRKQLTIKYKLNTEKKPKPIVRAEDEFELLKTLWMSEEVTFEHERQRVQLALIFQIAGITGNRPGAVLALRYEHVKITLLRDPGGGDIPRILIELAFKETKGYLGPKDINTFGIPDVPKEPCLLLCPQVMLLALAFGDEVFASSLLTKPDQLFQLRIPPNLNQLELPFRDEVLDQPIFRRVERGVQGYHVSQRQIVTDSWVRKRMRSLGEITGFELPVGPYCFRRGNGEALDSSSFISDSQRNLILQHSKSTVFYQNYLSRYITSDTQAAYRNLVPQTLVMRAASGMSRTIDSRRPRKLTRAQQRRVEAHPELRLLRRTWHSVAKTIRDRYGTLARAEGSSIHQTHCLAQKKYHAKKRQLERAALVTIRREYKRQQPVTDIAAQLTGKAGESASLQLQSAIPRLSNARQSAVDRLLTFATNTHNEECERRMSAINAIIALSQQQGQVTRSGKKPSSCKTNEKLPPPMNGNLLVMDALPMRCDSRQCLFCLGNTSLPPEGRLKIFHSRGTLRRHWQNFHLKYVVVDDPINCPHPNCNAKLQHVDHLRNHAYTVHNTPT